MKMAKASPEDLDMAMDLANVLDDIERGFFPTKLQSDEDAESERVEWIDTADRQQYERLFFGLKSLLNKGSISRVIWGMAVVCDPANECIDPDADTIEHHPKRQQLEQQVTELIAERDATNWKLREALDAVQQVANSSEGIAGWHLNGDIASWDSILPEVDEALALPNDATALNNLIAERTASLTAEVERLKDCWSAEGAQVDALRQQNAELTAQRDALLAFAASYIAAWNNGSTGDSDIFFMAESAIANCKEPGK